MGKVLLFVLILFASNVFPQSKYFIYFKHKEIEKGALLEKDSGVYKAGIQLLSQRTINRRIKNMDSEKLVTYEDLPIKEDISE